MAGDTAGVVSTTGLAAWLSDLGSVTAAKTGAADIALLSGFDGFAGSAASVADADASAGRMGTPGVSVAKAVTDVASSSGIAGATAPPPIAESDETTADSVLAFSSTGG